MTETIAIIDYGSGNLRSVAKAFEQAAGKDADICVTEDARRIADADRVVLPGVGAFGACMDGLAARKGVIEGLEHAVLVRQRPFLGVCVGMQLLAETGYEHGAHRGLAWIPGDVVAIERTDVSVPHMGWNTVTATPTAPLAAAMDALSFYFAHSFAFVARNAAHAVARVAHGGPITAAVARDNIIGVQFHPEKSQAAGLALIDAFLRWDP